MERIKTHPGLILQEEFLLPLKMSVRTLAEALQVPANQLTSIINGTSVVTASIAIELGRVFNTTSEFWLNLQQSNDLSSATDARDPRANKPLVP